MDIFRIQSNKKYAKLAHYYVLLITLSNVVTSAFRHSYGQAVLAAIMGAFIYYIVYKINTENIIMDEHEIKAGVTIPYMLISDIVVNDKRVEIISEDGRKGTINMIDAEANYDRYKELLDKLIERLKRSENNIKVVSEEILEKILENRKSFPEKKGKVELGGWLKFIKIMSTIMIVIGAIYLAVLPLLLLLPDLHDGDIPQLVDISINSVIFFIFGIIISVMLKKRKKNTMYAVASMQACLNANSLITYIIAVADNNSFENIAMTSIKAAILIAVTILVIHIVLDYFKNSNRAKYTLMN